MTSIERNFNGVLYRVSVKEEERRMRMVEGEAILQEPRVTEVAQEETGPGGPWRRWPTSGLEAQRMKVVSLEVTVGPSRGVLLQRWHQEGGEGEEVQVAKKNCFDDDLKR